MEVEDTIEFTIARTYEYNLDEPILEYLKLFGMPLKIKYSKDKNVYGCTLVYGHQIKKQIEELEEANEILTAENKNLKQELMEARRELHLKDLKRNNQ